MKTLLSKYMKQLPEQFNDSFILSRSDDQIIEHIRDIFKSLETIPEIHINPEEITFEKTESSFGPIKQSGKYYKSVLPSRLNKIHYVVHIDGVSKPIERDLYINKMLDNCFYINEGIRYYLIWQIVDSNSYGFEDGVSMKSLNLPITMMARQRYNLQAELDGPCLIDLPVFKAALFKKKVPPIVYIMAKYALESLSAAGMEKIQNIDEFINYNDEGIIEYLSNFFGFEIKFSDLLSDLIEDNRTIFSIKNQKEQGVYYSVPTDVIDTPLGRAFLASMSFITNEIKEPKKSITFNYTQLTNMWFWINEVGRVFNKSNDVYKKYEKVKTVYISLNRLIDDPTRKTLTIPSEYKENIFTIFKYIMANFDALMTADCQDLTNKRVRLYEYVLYPLRVYFGRKINSILNSATRTTSDLEKMFNALTPMYLIKECVTSELLHYYNATNEFDLFSSLLRYTFHGPAGYTNTVSIDQRSLHPSYTGRISLVASSPGSPGTSGTLVPFLKIYNGYFTEPLDI